MGVPMDHEYIFTKEYWSGDSKDGGLINGDGYHFFRMEPKGRIIEAYEMYEREDGEEVVTAMPEMHNVSWIDDLGFEDLEVLDQIEEREFDRIKYLNENQREA